MYFGKYRVREGSFAEKIIPILGMALVITVMGLGNHFIDGIY